MALFAEFEVPADRFVLGHTLGQLPEMVIEIERVVATGELLTPYFRVEVERTEAFEAAAAADPTIDNLLQVDEFGKQTLYRAEWTENVDALLHAYREVGAAISEASGQANVWELRIRFDAREQLDAFQSFCEDHDIAFELRRLYEASRTGEGGAYGLTPKQYEAATRAWESGYFDSPRKATLSDVAADLGISTQALSDRLRRCQYNLVAETLMVTPPAEPEFPTTRRT